MQYGLHEATRPRPPTEYELYWRKGHDNHKPPKGHERPGSYRGHYGHYDRYDSWDSYNSYNNYNGYMSRNSSNSYATATMTAINVIVTTTSKQYDSYYGWNSYVNHDIFNS